MSATPPLPPDWELVFSYARSGGPGGQHVNKTESKVLLRWSVDHASFLSVEEKARVKQRLRMYLTNDGELLLSEEGSRSRAENQEAVVARLRQLVAEARIPPKRRKKTRVGRGQREARMQGKKHRAQIKAKRTFRDGE